MRITISSGDGRSAGLRVIPSIPDYSLCHLEGRNGIGKSVAARLIELATGARPYANSPHAWQTLKDQLGRTQIAIGGLAEGQELNFDVDPERWILDTTRSMGEDFATVTLNHRPSSVAEARSLLAVRRISGDESLLQTLARELDEQRSSMEAIRTLRIAPLRRAWDLSLNELTAAIGSISRASLEGSRSRVQHLIDNQVQAHRRASQIHQLTEHLDDVVFHTQALWLRRTRLADALQALTRATQGIATARAMLDEATKDTEQAAVSMARSQGDQDLVRHWQQLLRRRQRGLDTARSRETQVLDALGLQERPSAPTLAQQQQSTQRQLQAALTTRDEVDLVIPLRSLVNDLLTPLPARIARLGGEVVAVIDSPITASQLMDGLAARRADLAGRPRADELRKLDETIAEAQQRGLRLSRLAEQMRATDQKGRLVHEAESELERLFVAADGATRENYEIAAAAVERARNELLAHQIAGREARRRIAELLGIPAEDAVTPAPAPAPADGDGKAEEGNGEEVEFETLEESDGAVEDAFFPDLDVAHALHLARVADARARAALVRLGESSLTEVLEGAEPPALSELIAATHGDPTQALGDAAVNGIRSLLSLGPRATTAARSASEQVQACDEALQAAETELHLLHLQLKQAVNLLIGSAESALSAWRPAAALLLQAAGVTVEQAQDVGLVDSVGPTAEADERKLLVADALESLSLLASAQANAASVLADNLGTIDLHLRATVERISPQARSALAETAPMVDGASGPALDRWVEDELADLLMAPELLEALFDRAVSVRVSLADLTLTWKPASGGVRKRPLEAFSSGEQVFAYTRANLARLGRQRFAGQQLIVFLDEFGAFVARDRLGQLMNFVEHEALGNVADQVIIMLPLSRDYPAPDPARGLVAGSAVAARGVDWQEERRRQLADRGYFAVPFGAGQAQMP